MKQLYYRHEVRLLWCASEVKAILEDPAVPRRMDVSALHAYMTMLWVPDPQTMFEGIIKLPPGHYALFRDGELTLTRYWDLAFPPAGHEYATDEAALVDELRARFRATVQAQMLSDVPLGAFLSAGLDSSGIVAALAEASTQPVRTFTISFPPEYRRDVAMDDTDVAARTAAYLGADHTEIVVEPDVVDLLPRLIWNMDEPVADPALITAYLVCRAAREYVTVMLSGAGGDEVFAGYRKYRAHALAQTYQRVPGVLRRRMIEPALRALPAFQGTRLGGYVRLAKKMVRSGSLPPRERFLMDSVYLTEAQTHALYVPDLRAQVAGVDPFARQRTHFETVAGADFLHQMLYVDLRAYMVSLNLLYNDKMGMAASVEVRVPFLDWTLAEWVAQHVPPYLKLRGGVTKHIYRQAMRSDLPAEVFRQPKAGFAAPIAQWLNRDLRAMIDDVLSVDTLRRRGLFDPEAVHTLLRQHRRGTHDWSFQLWQFLTLELWMQAFLD
ncbi:MAG: asparagine synthase C-terminal domain-containing protein [Anaerolineae bacterium]|nr:asparagine synthase C-terminal domain-containing protein [Anaerolineae bacterium]